MSSSEAAERDVMDVGEHCEMRGCAQLDFLPFTCSGCKSTFCLEHRGTAAHSCPRADAADVTVLLCPLCAASVRLVPGADANAVWAAHAADSRACIPSAYAQRTTKARCPVGACREKLVFSNTVRCRSCGTATCLRHRYAGDHACRTPQQQQPRTSLSAAAAAVARQAAPKAPPVFSSLASLKAKAAGQYSEPSNSLAGTAQRRAAAAAPPAMHSGGGSAGREVCPACGWRCDDVVKLVEHHAAVHEARAQSACQVC